MPYTKKKLPSGKYRVSGPSGVHAKGTTKAKAEGQIRIMEAAEHRKKVHHSPTMTEIDHSLTRPHAHTTEEL
jgi:hypothetical protein